MLEPLYRSLSEEVDDNGQAIPIGTGEIIRSGEDVTVVTYGPIRHNVKTVADGLAEESGIDVEIIDLKALIPYDIDLIVGSVNKTGRLIIVHEASETLGFGAELATQIQQLTSCLSLRIRAATARTFCRRFNFSHWSGPIFG